MPSKESLVAANNRLVAFSVTKPTRAMPAVPPDPGELSVAVVVPTYRDAQFLKDALESVKRQTFSGWRCYVVDDASPQDVPAIAQAFAAEDDRFVYLRHGANAGLAAARNTALRHVREPVVQFLDADDMLTPWALGERLNVLRTYWFDPRVAGVHGQVIQCTEETTLATLSKWTGRPMVNRRDWIESEGESPFSVHAPLTRTALIVGLGGFDERFLNGAEDWDLWHRVLRHGYVFEPCPTVVGAYRQRRASMIREHSHIHLDRADAMLERAIRPAIVDRDLVVSNAAMPVTTAAVAHRRMIRAARWAGIRTAQSAACDVEIDSEILSFVDVANAPATRRDDYVKAARGGLVRGLGLSTHVLGELAGESKATLDALAEKIADRLLDHVAPDEPLAAPPPSDAIDLVGRADVDIALVAETVADVDVLWAAAQVAVDDSTTIVAIDVDYVKGDEGASARWEHHPVQLVPYNEVALGKCRPRLLLARRPAGPVTLDLLEACEQWGGTGRILEEPSRELEVPTTPSANAALEEIAAPDIAGLSERLSPTTTHQPWRGTEFCALLPREETAIDTVGCERLRAMRNRHVGETAVIIGNGPSLNDTDLSLLAGRQTFGVNAIFLANDRLPEKLSYYVVEDTAVFKDNMPAIKAYEADHKLFPTLYRPNFSDDEISENTIFFRMNMGFYGRATGTTCHPRFSTDASQRVFCGQSVTIINLQLAHWLGFARVVLIGMDFSYTIPEDADRSGNTIVSRSDDPNHFHPDYFGAGKTWKDPKLDRVLINYRLARDVYEATDRQIINASVGGKLELFKRMTLAEALS